LAIEKPLPLPCYFDFDVTSKIYNRQDIEISMGKTKTIGDVFLDFRERSKNPVKIGLFSFILILLKKYSIKIFYLSKRYVTFVRLYKPCFVVNTTGYFKWNRLLYFIRAVYFVPFGGCRKFAVGRGSKSCTAHATVGIKSGKRIDFVKIEIIRACGFWFV